MDHPINPNAPSAELEELHTRLETAEETLRAIRSGEVDAVVVLGPSGPQIYTLESAEQPYRVLIEQMQEGALTLSEDGLILYCNLRFAEMMRTPPERVIAAAAHSFVVPEFKQQFASLLQMGMSRSARAEIALRAADGTILPAFITVSPLPIEVEGCLCMVVTDLTEQESLRRNQAEINKLNERLKRSMTETHHRVKNSLQIIAAMIEMRVSEGEPTLPIAELVRLGRQVGTLAMVHDLLTIQAKADSQADSISASALLTKLLPLWHATTGARRIQVQLADVQVSTRQGTSLALITNELVTNAFKHGIGDVQVTFQADEGTATLEVCDDGPGFPPGFDGERINTTGLDLVANLSRWDLGGYAQFQNRPQGGAKITIHILLEPVKR